MRFSKEDMEYLSGKKFSIWYKLKLSNNSLFSRIEFILDIVKNKRVLHIGCCDHVPNIMDKVKNRTWLHGLLLENCSFAAGVDINKEAIRYVLENELVPSGFGGVYHADITVKMPNELENEKFDYAILGEVLEHVNDPVSFLIKIKRNLQHNVEKIIITVPSYAFGLRQMFSGLFKREYINSDHRYWFSPYTIAKVCVESGIYPEELLFYGNPPLPLKILRSIKRKLHLKELSCFSALSNGLIIIGVLNKN